MEKNETGETERNMQKPEEMGIHRKKLKRKNWKKLEGTVRNGEKMKKRNGKKLKETGKTGKTGSNGKNPSETERKREKTRRNKKKQYISAYTTLFQPIPACSSQPARYLLTSAINGS